MQTGTEIVGRYVLAFVESTGDVSPVFERKTREIFADNGLDVGEIDEDDWVDASAYADAMQAIREEVGEKTLRQAGIEQAKNVTWPAEVQTVEDALEFVVQADGEAHRAPDGDYGSYTVDLVGETTARVGVTEAAPYPTENFEGVFEGVVKSFTDSADVRVTETDRQGGERTAFEIGW